MRTHDQAMDRWRSRVSVVGLAVLVSITLAAFTTHVHVQARGMEYLDVGNQIKRHQQVLAGVAGNPWQYRILSTYLVEGVIRLFRVVGIHHPHVFAFIAFRVAQDTAIFLAFFLYLRELGIRHVHTMIGAMILAWGMSHAHYDSDLQFSTYFDILFYLLAGIVILTKRSVWILPITALAAVNRETCGLIPIMYLASVFVANPGTSRTKAVYLTGLSLGVYFLVFVCLRLAYGEQPLLVAYGHTRGLQLFRFNVLRTVTWWQCLATFGLVPVLALFGYQSWPIHLRVFFWVVVPIWFMIHLVAAVMAETRLLLVPQALVFIPGALLYAQQTAGACSRRGSVLDGALQPMQSRRPDGESA